MLSNPEWQAAVLAAESAVIERLKGGEGPSLRGVLEQLHEETRDHAWRAAAAAALAAGANPEAMYAAGAKAGAWPDAPMVPLEGVEEWAQRVAEAAVTLQVAAWGTVEWQPRWAYAFAVFATRDCVPHRVSMPQPAPADRRQAALALRDEILRAVWRCATVPGKGE